MKIALFGVGRECEKWFKFIKNERDIEVVAFFDNNKKWHNTTYADTNIVICNPNNLNKYEFDYIIITPKDFSTQIYQQLINFGIAVSQIKVLDEFIVSIVVPKLSLKYKNTNNSEIRRMLDVFNKKGISVFGDFIPDMVDRNEVLRDFHNRPYILYYGKKMYYPINRKFYIEDGKEYVLNITREQSKNSPHLYLKDEDDIKEGDIIVDAGVCEGNFALKYIEKVSKVYLIECDPNWMDSLRLTFEPWKEKVVFCNKFLGRYDSNSQITLDTLVQENIDFLKMDIEGAEIDALLGGKNVLSRSNAKCAICSYHKMNDEIYIRFLLENLGYKTATSSGYMFFLHDEDITETLDLRRGIVYGER